MKSSITKLIWGKNSGVILLITMWILLILTLFAIGIGYQVGLELRLNRYNVDSLKASYMAKAGIQAALFQLQKDTNDYDTLYECGITLEEGQTPQAIFNDIAVGECHFAVQYPYFNSISGSSQQVSGMQDEERKININALNAQDINILKKLFEQFGIDTDEAGIIAASIVDWKDPDSNVTNTPDGAEDEYYMGLEKPYHCKNAPFQSLDELLLVRGITQDISDKIKGYLAVCPSEATVLKVNVNTASKIVLRALARAYAETSSGGTVNQDEADNFVENIVNYRAGSDTIEATEDDQPITQENMGEVGLNLPLWAGLQGMLVYTSSYFKVNSQGFSRDGRVTMNIEAVFEREQPIPIYWHEG